MKRIRWIAGSQILASELDAEQDYLAERQIATHEVRVHGTPGDTRSGAVGSVVRAVDRSVAIGLSTLAGLKPVPVKSDESVLGAFNRRTWAVAIVRDILSVGWTGGSRLAGRISARLACDGLSGGGAVRLTRAGPLPDAPKPFRLLRVAADRKAKTPESVIVELAAAADPNGAKETPDPSQQKAGPIARKATVGLRVGAADANGFLPLLEVVPGRGVVIRGGLDNPGGRIVRKPPGSEPSDEQLVQAFMRTEAGQKERVRIEEAAENLKKLGMTIDSFDEFPPGSEQWKISWTLTNKDQDIKLKRIESRAALAPASADPTISPAWTKLKPPEKPHLVKGETISGGDTVALTPAGVSPRKMLIIVAEADYGVPVTLFKEK